jgi:hypothetical protein
MYFLSDLDCLRKIGREESIRPNHPAKGSAQRTASFHKANSTPTFLFSDGDDVFGSLLRRYLISKSS